MAIVLGISIGTRTIGLAVMDKGYLLDCRVKCFPGQWSNKKLTDIMDYLDRFIITNGIPCIALKLNTPERSSKSLVKLTKSLLKLVQGYEMGLQTYTIHDIKALCKDQPNKSEVARYFTKIYPHLYKEYCKEKKYSKGYYTKMFEAIAAAYLAS